MQDYEIDSNLLSLIVHLRLLIHTDYFPYNDGTNDEYGYLINCIEQPLLAVVAYLVMDNQLEFELKY